MNYDYELAVSADISTQVAEEMIRNIVEKQTSKRISSITAKVVDGKFEGFLVMFDTESPTGRVAKSNDKIDRTFKVTTYS